MPAGRPSSRAFARRQAKPSPDRVPDDGDPRASNPRVSSLFLAAWSLVLRRAASDLLIVAAAFVTILLAATILAAGPIYANAVAASGLERTLADAPARDSGLQVSARIPLEDLDRTSARVERTLKDAFGDASGPVYRSAVSDSYELPAARGREQGSLAVCAFYVVLAAHADLVGGRGPSAGTSTEAALSVGAARSLGLAVGDSIQMTSVIDESRRVQR